MGRAIEAVLGFNNNMTGSTTFDALTAGTNQSFSVRNFNTGKCWLTEIWATESVGPFTLSIKSPKMHDNVYGILLSATPKTQGGTSVFNPVTMMPGYTKQELYASDTLSVTCNAGASGDKIAALMLVQYDDLSGINARLYGWPVIQPLIRNLVGVQVTPSVSSTAGQWGTAALLNSGKYELKANTDYAILGYTVSIPCAAVSIMGTDTGNLQIGGPGFNGAGFGGQYFQWLSVQYGNAAFIPVVNANNAGGTQINIADTATSGTFLVTLLMAELSQLLPNPGGF